MSELPASLLEFKRAVVLRPEDPDARYALAQRMFEEGQVDGAIKQLGEALARRPDFPGAARLLARAHARAGRTEESRRALEALVRVRPRDPDARDELAEHFISGGRADDALLQVEEAARLQPHDVRRFVKAAELAVRKGLVERALDLLARGLAIAPGDAPAAELLRSIAEELGDLGAVPSSARQLASRCPELLEASRAVAAGNAAAAKRALVAAPPEVQARPEYAEMRALVKQMGSPAAGAGAGSSANPSASAGGGPADPHVLLERLRLRRASDTTVGRIGVLGWTPVGGAVSPLEAMAVPGKGELIFSGNVGATGREAGQVAFTCLKARAEALGIGALVRSHDLHLHFTDTEMGKEGLSSGLALALAGLSAYLQRPLRPRLGGTGEITLHGDVRRVAGIHEKVVAAYLAGLTAVLLPRGNVRDAQQLPAEVRDRMQLVHVDTVADALGAALEP